MHYEEAVERLIVDFRAAAINAWNHNLDAAAMAQFANIASRLIALACVAAGDDASGDLLRTRRER